MAPVLRSLLCALLAAAYACAAPRAAGFRSGPTGTNSSATSENSSEQQEPPTGGVLAGSALLFKVQVNDLLSRRRLSRATVEVFINHSRSQTVLTGEDGEVTFRIPDPTGSWVIVVASKDGYVSAQLPCITDGPPEFSSLTLSLLPHNRGNVWFFNDSVLITDTQSGADRGSAVQFPRRLLSLDDSNVTSVEAYLTSHPLQGQDGLLKTWGIVTAKSGRLSVALTPAAAVSAQLFSKGAELQVGGPIRINLSLPDSCSRWRSSVVPAWYLNRTTGGWMRKGLGTVESLGGRLVWTFTAPHLGDWMAASLTASSDPFSLDASAHFLLQHWFLLLLLGGGAGGLFSLLLCLLLATVCCSRKSLTVGKTRRAAATSDQSTSTGQDGVSSDDLTRSLRSPPPTLADDDVIANASVVSGHLELNAGLNHLMAAERLGLSGSLMENLFFCNQPVAVLHAPAFFQLEEGSERSSGSTEPPRSRSATLFRPSAPNAAAAAAVAAPQLSQGGHAHAGTGLDLPRDSAPSSTSTTRATFSLQESLSVPGTLNRLLPPRAWFVSLEGKPAAEVRYAEAAAAPEQQRRRRAADSRDTSLDSGVDMSELGHSASRKVALERNATFVKSTREAGGRRNSNSDL